MSVAVAVTGVVVAVAVADVFFDVVVVVIYADDSLYDIILYQKKA